MMILTDRKTKNFFYGIQNVVAIFLYFYFAQWGVLWIVVLSDTKRHQNREFYDHFRIDSSIFHGHFW